MKRYSLTLTEAELQVVMQAMAGFRDFLIRAPNILVDRESISLSLDAASGITEVIEIIKKQRGNQCDS